MRTLTKTALIALIAVTTAAFAAGLAGGEQRTASAATSGVSIKGFRFSPATINIKVGEQVRWLNDEDAVPHTATSEKGGAFSSKTLRSGETFLSEPFKTEGSYPYFCIIHPAMRGVVNVGEATGSPSAPPAALAAAPISLRLQGSQEVPAVTTVSNGTFNATAGANSLSWAALVYGSGFTAGHIHSGAAGTNGPVVAFLFGPDSTGQNQLSLSGTITEANLVGPMAGKWADFSRALAAGQLYVNFHTAANPGGEVRAQITLTPGAPSTGTSAGSPASSSPSWLAAIAAVLAITGGSVVFGTRMKARR